MAPPSCPKLSANPDIICRCEAITAACMHPASWLPVLACAEKLQKIGHQSRSVLLLDKGTGCYCHNLLGR